MCIIWEKPYKTFNIFFYVFLSCFIQACSSPEGLDSYHHIKTSSGGDKNISQAPEPTSFNSGANGKTLSEITQNHATGGKSDPTQRNISEKNSPDSVVLNGLSLATMPKISHAQYEFVIEDIFGVSTNVRSRLSRDEKLEGFPSLGLRHFSLSSLAIEKYYHLAFEISNEVFSSSKKIKDLSGCDCKASSDNACLIRFIMNTSEKLFRNPQSEESLNSVINISQNITENLCNKMEASLAVMLNSPKFIYHTAGQGQKDESVETKELTSFEQANKLSFLLWNSVPDDKLLKLAANGDLNRQDIYESEVDRMLGSPKLKRGILQFFEEYLDLDQLKIETQTDLKIKEEKSALLTEINMFISFLLVNSDKNISEFLTSKETFVNKISAPVYGMTSNSLNFEKISLPDSQQRMGILGKAGMMQILSHGEETSPTQRGKLISEQFLCKKLPQPPANADITLPETEDELTKKELLELHTTSESCKGCHIQMDPPGLVFEIFDSKGRIRSQDTLERPIDTNVTYDGRDFNHANELLNYLAQSDDFKSCFAKKILDYSLGYIDDQLKTDMNQPVMKRWKEKGYTLKSLLKIIVTSPKFKKIDMNSL